MKGAKGGGGAAFELPRTDISGKITATLMKELADPNWQVCCDKYG